MKKVLHSLTLLIAFLALTNFNVKAQDGKDPYLVKTLSNITIEKVDISTFGGIISVGGNSATPGVEVYVTPNNSGLKKRLNRENIQQIVNSDYDIKIDVNGTKLIVAANPKRRNQNPQISISFKVFVQGSTDTHLETSGGSIYLSDLKGRQDFTTSGGSLFLNNVHGKITGKTSGGSIDVKNSGGDVNLVTSGGSITAVSGSGNISLNTSGGSINLQQLDGDIKASTSGGSITGSDIKGKLNVNTSGGSLNLKDLSCSLQSSTSAGSTSASFISPKNFIKIKNSAGTVTVKLPQKIGYNLNIRGSKVDTKGMRNVDGDFGNEKVIAKVNGGGIPVEINNNNGKVNVSVR